MIIRSNNTKKQGIGKFLLNNNENKNQFVKILFTVWSNGTMAHKLKCRKVILICEGSAHMLTSANGLVTKTEIIDCLQNPQEETDTRIVLCCKYAEDQDYKFITVTSLDTDIFILL